MFHKVTLNVTILVMLDSGLRHSEFSIKRCLLRWLVCAEDSGGSLAGGGAGDDVAARQAGGRFGRAPHADRCATGSGGYSHDHGRDPNPWFTHAASLCA